MIIHYNKVEVSMVLIPVAFIVLLLVLIYYAAWWEAYRKK